MDAPKHSPSGVDIIVKAQIHAGGRGKGHFVSPSGEKIDMGGVKITQNLDEVADFTGKMLGNNLITKQTSDVGQTCKKVLINEGINIKRELYVIHPTAIS